MFYQAIMAASLISFRSAVVRSSISRVTVGFRSTSIPRMRAAAGIATLSDNHFPSKPSPCLMLPTAFKGGDLVYSFYSLAEDIILSFNQRCGKKLVDDDAVVVGTGHGWLATFNASGNHDLFLSHPISGQHIKLPPMIPTPVGFFHGPANKLWDVKVIISSSPEKEECRAVMSIYGLGLTGLAYCLPGRSIVWAPLCGLLQSPTNFVYSRRQQCFICIFSPPRIGIESWDLRNADQPPRMDSFKEEVELEYDYKNCPWSGEGLQQVQYIVLEEDSDDLYIVRRFIETGTDFDGSCKTFGLLVFKVEIGEGGRRKATHTSIGPTMFLGTDRSFALSSSSAAAAGCLKPNSIYFTNPTHCPAENGHASIDVGIYDYGEGTMAHRHCPFEVEGVPVGYLPGPVWFTPGNMH